MRKKRQNICSNMNLPEQVKKLPVLWTVFITKFSATITGIDAEVLAGEVRKRRGTVFMHEKGEVRLFLKSPF